MANWNNGAPGYGYVGYATLGVNLNRQKNADLDVSSTYTSKEDACYYVTEGRYPVDGAGVTQDIKDMVKYPYLGQIIKIVNSESETVDFYFIKTAVWDGGLSSTDEVFNHYFEKFGSASITTDEKSISLQDGVLSLTSFNKEYYKYKSDTESWDEAATSGFAAGLQPRVIGDGVSGYKIGWFEPSSTTVEGLADSINALQSSKADKADTLAGYGITDAYTKTDTDNKIKTSIESLGTVFNLAGYMTQDEFGNAQASEYKVGDVIIVDGVKEYVVVDKGEPDSPNLQFEPFGDPSGVTALEGRVDALETTINTPDTGLSAKVDSLTNIVTASTTGLVDKVAGIESSLSTLNTTVTDPSTGLVKKVSDLETNYTELDDSINNAETGLNKKVSDLETAVDDINTSITTGEIHTSITNLQSAVSTNSDAIEELTSTVSGHTESISTIENKLGGIAEGAQANVIESVALGTGVTGEVQLSEKTATINITSVDTSKKVANKLTIAGLSEKAFDGSAPIDISVSDLSTALNLSGYATAAQGAKADSAIQSVKVAGVALTPDEQKAVNITADNISTAIGLSEYAKKSELPDISDVAKKSEANVFTQQNTFNGAVTMGSTLTVQTPTENSHAASKKYVDDTLSAGLKANDAMHFKGLLDSTHPLPSASGGETITNGDTYKVAEAGTYEEQPAKVGDMFIALVTTGDGDSATVSWQYIPSADDGNVSSDSDLTAGQLVVGNGNKTLTTVANGTSGQILQTTGSGVEWADQVSVAAGASGDLSVQKSGSTYTVEVAKINAMNLYTNEGDVLILDCGDSSFAQQ